MSKVLKFRVAAVCLLLAMSLVPASAAETDSVDRIIESMTLEHKVAQMFMVNLFGPILTDSGRELLETWQPGAVVLVKTNVIRTPENIASLIHDYQQTITRAGGVPLFVAVDQEGGLIQRLRYGFTTWPVPMLLTAADDEVLARRVGQGMAAELRTVGINMNLAPVADLYTNFANPIIGRRSPGSDVELVGSTVAALVTGMQSEGVLATLKHFPGHGDTSEDSHTSLPAINHTPERLAAVELLPFAAGLDAGAGAVMVAHIRYPALDDTLPASLSPAIVTDLLRVEMAYDGLVVTDALDMDAIDLQYSPEEAAVQAVIAGNDLILIGANAGEAIQGRAMQAVVDAVRSGTIDEARIDDSVRRILLAKQQMGVLDWQPADFDAAALEALNERNGELVEAMFRAGATVVQDTSNLLPVGDADAVGVIFPGTRYGIQRMCGAYRTGIRWMSRSARPTAAERAAAVSFAASLDAVVVFVEDAVYDTDQQLFVQALPAEKTIVVALSSPFDLARFPQVSTYIATYSPMDTGVDTVCGVVFGVLEARGTLPVDLDIVPG